jgi:hypothetical protein
VRGFPSATAPSHADDEVRTVPEQPALTHSRLALDDDIDDGPLVG